MKANRLLGYTSPILKWAAAEDLSRLISRRTSITHGAETKRERTLS